MRPAALCALSLMVGLLAPRPAQAARIKDVAQFEGARINQLVGYGIVVGLDGTGDTWQTTFTEQSLAAMLSRMGVRIDPHQLRLRNVAAVMVTANLPPFARPGTRIDVSVSSIGDARSLEGGVLLVTPLRGVDGKTYAVAQGAIQVGGYEARGRTGSRRRKNHLNVGRVPRGATVERALDVDLVSDGKLRLHLLEPDLTTATAIAKAIDEALGNDDAARVENAGSVVVAVPADAAKDPMGFAARIEAIEVQPDAPARVVINERTGTVVLGEHVRIAPVAVAHGGLTVEVTERISVSQPGALSGGSTVAVPQSSVRAKEAGGALHMVQGGATLADLVRALNALGATPRDLVEILQAIAAAGALQARLEVL